MFYKLLFDNDLCGILLPARTLRRLCEEIRLNGRRPVASPGWRPHRGGEILFNTLPMVIP